MKHSLLLLAFISAPVMAGPFLVANAYPSTATQPTSAEFTINGGAAKPCTLEAVTAGKQPKCDLASITAAGDYTLVMTVRVTGATPVAMETTVQIAAVDGGPEMLAQAAATGSYTCVNEPNAATCTTGAGTASSAPFTYKLRI